MVFQYLFSLFESSKKDRKDIYKIKTQESATHEQFELSTIKSDGDRSNFINIQEDRNLDHSLTLSKLESNIQCKMKEKIELFDKTIKKVIDCHETKKDDWKKIECSLNEHKSHLNNKKAEKKVVSKKLKTYSTSLNEEWIKSLKILYEEIDSTLQNIQEHYSFEPVKRAKNNLVRDYGKLFCDKPSRTDYFKDIEHCHEKYKTEFAEKYSIYLDESNTLSKQIEDEMKSFQERVISFCSYEKVTFTSISEYNKTYHKSLNGKLKTFSKLKIKMTKVFIEFLSTYNCIFSILLKYFCNLIYDIDNFQKSAEAFLSSYRNTKEISKTIEELKDIFKQQKYLMETMKSNEDLPSKKERWKYLSLESFSRFNILINLKKQKICNFKKKSLIGIKPIYQQLLQSNTKNPSIPIYFYQSMKHLQNEYDLSSMGSYDSFIVPKNKEGTVIFKRFNFDKNESYENFFNEVFALNSIKHDNVIPIHCIHHVDSVMFVELPFYPEGHLFSTKLQISNESQFYSIAKQLFLGLSAIHLENITHCDINPQKIFVKSTSDASFKIVVGGFDVSLNEDNFIHDHSYNEENEYTAPELKKHPHIISKKCDIYSAGMILKNIFPTLNFRQFHIISKLIHDCCSEDPDDRPSVSQALSVIVTLCESVNEEFQINDYPTYWKYPHNTSKFPLHLSTLTLNKKFKSFKIVKFYRIQNEDLWYIYSTRRKIMKNQLTNKKFNDFNKSNVLKKPKTTESNSFDLSTCEHSLNEIYLFHSTSPDMVDKIIQHGFKKSSNKGNFGSGIYFSSSCTYSASFHMKCKDKYYPMFVSRVLLGDSKRVGLPNILSKQYTSSAPKHSVIGGYGDSTNFVVYEASQTYPEYLFWYKIK